MILIPVTNAIERLHEEFKRRIKTQTVRPSADTAAMLFWASLASGQINMRKVDGWQTLATKLRVIGIDAENGGTDMAAFPEKRTSGLRIGSPSRPKDDLNAK